MGLTLTDEEVEMITKTRESASESREIMLQRKVSLAVAAKYETWLQDNNTGSTFSTFVNNYGYEEPDATWRYKVVEAIRSALDE
jgi:hypothetical protein